MEVEVIGNLYPDNKHQSGNVYSVGGGSTYYDERYTWLRNRGIDRDSFIGKKGRFYERVLWKL